MKKYIIIIFIILLVLLFPLPSKPNTPYGCEFGPCYYSYNSIGTIILRNIAGSFGIKILPPDRM